MADAAIAESTCAECRAVLPAGARFCPGCGTSATQSREVRKTVTLLFTDVTGSTAMGEALDPEAYRGVMGRYFDVAREAVERHGGTVEKFVGDAVLAVFGVPDVREDDALRAVRAAGELNEAVRDLSAELVTSHGVTLAIRTGVNTGSVVSGTARAGGSFATGDAVNTAARLEQAAGPGEILLGVATWHLVRDAVDVEPVEPVTAKGKAEPVPAYRLLTVRAGEDGHARSFDAPMVGRVRETRALEDALERTVASGRSHLVTVLGPPGIGKTRLVSDFIGRIGDRAEVLRGRCVSYGQGITFFPIVQVIRSALRLSGGEHDEVVRQRLTTTMAGATGGPDVVELLLALLGASTTPGSHDQTCWAIRRLVEQLAERRPLVVTVADLHWAEPGLLDLLARLQDEVVDLPFLLVCDARPELAEAHPDWGRGSLNSLTFGLEPFDHREVGERVSTVLDDGVPDAVVRAVADWSGGNPLFVEEIVSHLVEEGALARADGSWTLTRDTRDISVPPSVAAVLAARLDRVPVDQRGLLERVSVIGLEFTTADAIGLADPGGPEVPGTLVGLARRDLLRRVRSSDGESWAFRHQTIRDAAYDVLPKALRAELHERFADALAGTGAGTDAGAERRTFVAHHLEQAVRLRRQLAPHDPALEDLTARAADCLALASDEARERDDARGAAALMERAIDLHHPSSASRRDHLVGRLRLHTEAWGETDTTGLVGRLAEETDESATPLDQTTLEVEQLWRRMLGAEEMDPVPVIALCERLELLASDAGNQLRVERARIGMLFCYAMVARFAGAEQVAERMRHSSSAAATRQAAMVRASVLFNGAVSFERAAELLDRRPITENEVRWQGLFEAAASAATDPVGSREAVDGALAAIAALDDSALVHAYLAMVHELRGDLDRAIEHERRAAEIALAAGRASFASTNLGHVAALKLDRGDPAVEAVPLLEEAQRWTSPYDVVSVALNHQIACLLAIRDGRLADAREHSARSLIAIDKSDNLWAQADLRRLVSELPRTTGDSDEERRLLTEALDRYRRKGIVHWARVCEERLAELG